MIQKITALKLQKRDRHRVNVYLDGEYAFSLTRIVAAWLQVGQEINDERIAQLQSENTLEMAYQRALKFIGYRPRTEAELRRGMASKELPKEIVDLVVERLKQNGLINDASFARNWMESRITNRPRSRRVLAYELGQRGVETQIINQNLENLDDEELAYQAALKKGHKLENVEWKVFLQRMYRYLSQRGFSYETSSHAISRVWEEIRSTDKSIDHEATL